MKSNTPNKKLTPEQEQEFFAKLEVPYQRSKSEVWEKLASTLKNDTSENDDPTIEKSNTKVVSLKRKRAVYLSIAASFLILTSVGLFARFYTKTIEVNAGQFTSHTLPDGSQIHLNAATKIAYAPYWWRFSRKVSLKGEAFFEVAKGKKFQVVSERGVTQVLGTKFNIRSRDTTYEVFCTEGKVRVSDHKSKEVVIVPGEFAEIKAKKVKKFTFTVAKKEEVLSWRLKKFIYNYSPLARVLKDIERHYNVKIETNLSYELLNRPAFTGLFRRSLSIDEVLKIVCYSLSLTFESTSSRSFVISNPEK